MDFVNDRDEIREAFKTYYEGSELGEEGDPARMYAVKEELDASAIYLAEEVERFCAVYFKPVQRQGRQDHRAMNAALDPAVSRFTALREDDENEAELWRGKVQAFRSLYGFLSQVIPYQDSELERLYAYLRHLSAKLPRRRSGPAYHFDDDVRLAYYRLQKISEGSIALDEGEARRLDGPTEVGSGLAREQEAPLSQLIDIINQRFGTDFNEADQLFFDQIVETAVADQSLRETAAVNSAERFELTFRNLADGLFTERMDQNEEIYVRYMNDESFRNVVGKWLGAEAYRRLRQAVGAGSEADRLAEAPRTPNLRVVRGHWKQRYVTCVPLVPLAAAGAFGTPQNVADQDDWQWVELNTKRRLAPGMFVARIVGRSMEPAIPDGAYALFRAPVAGTRQGKTVLVELRDALDPETGRYTVKRYESVKTGQGDAWRHAKITLTPANPEFDPIVLQDVEEDAVQVVAELLEVIDP